MTLEEKTEALAPYMTQLLYIAYILDDVPAGLHEKLLEEAGWEAYYRHCQREGLPDDNGNPLPPLPVDEKKCYCMVKHQMSDSNSLSIVNHLLIPQANKTEQQHVYTR